MFDQKKLKLTDIIKVEENRYLTQLTFIELAELVNLGIINIDLSIEIPYVPLTKDSTIYLNLNNDTNSFQYDNDKKELILNDSKFDCFDGRTRLITFMKECNEENMPTGRITLTIVTSDTNEVKKFLVD